MVAHLPHGSPWTITAIGRHQTPMLLRALLMDAPGIRVGFEDNVYLKKGVLARSNAELVEHAVHLAELVGKRPAEPAGVPRLLRPRCLRWRLRCPGPRLPVLFVARGFPLPARAEPLSPGSG